MLGKLALLCLLGVAFHQARAAPIEEGSSSRCGEGSVMNEMEVCCEGWTFIRIAGEENRISHPDKEIAFCCSGMISITPCQMILNDELPAVEGEEVKLVEPEAVVDPALTEEVVKVEGLVQGDDVEAVGEEKVEVVEKPEGSEEVVVELVKTEEVDGVVLSDSVEAVVDPALLGKPEVEENKPEAVVDPALLEVEGLVQGDEVETVVEEKLVEVEKPVEVVAEEVVKPEFQGDDVEAVVVEEKPEEVEGVEHSEVLVEEKVEEPLVEADEPEVEFVENEFEGESSEESKTEEEKVVVESGVEFVEFGDDPAALETGLEEQPSKVETEELVETKTEELVQPVVEV